MSHNIKIGVKRSSTSERDRAAASSGAPAREHPSRSGGELGDASAASGKDNGADYSSRSFMAEGPDSLLLECLAYSYWEERGRPDGSPEDDWLRAEAMLRKDLDR